MNEVLLENVGVQDRLFGTQLDVYAGLTQHVDLPGSWYEADFYQARTARKSPPPSPRTGHSLSISIPPQAHTARSPPCASSQGKAHALALELEDARRALDHYARQQPLVALLRAELLRTHAACAAARARGALLERGGPRRADERDERGS